MTTLNKVTIIGNLGRDPKPNDSRTMCELHVATSKKWKDKETNETKEDTQWHRVKLFQKQSELALKYLSKGSKVYIEGELRTSKYEKDGVTHYSTDIYPIAYGGLIFLDRKSDAGGDNYSAPETDAPSNDEIPF